MAEKDQKDVIVEQGPAGYTTYAIENAYCPIGFLGMKPASGIFKMGHFDGKCSEKSN